MMPRSMLESILHGLRRCTLPVQVTILGGEPTLHPLLGWFIAKLLELEQLKACNLMTNAVKDPPQIDDDRLSIVPAWHPLEVDDEKFLSYIRRHKKHITAPVIIMLPKYADRAQYIISELINQFSIRPSPAPIHTNNVVIPYNVDVSDDVERIYQFKGREWTFNELVKSELNRFKGWRCLASSYKIGVEGDVRRACEMLGKMNITEFLSNVKPEWITCDRESCVDDCLVELPKYNGPVDENYEAALAENVGR